MSALMNVADFLKSAPISSMQGVPMGNVLGVFLHIIISSSEGAIVITGQAADVANRTEAFFLTEEDFKPSEWRTELDGGPVWQVEDLTGSGRDTPLKQIGLLPRVINFYFDPGDRDRGLFPRGPLDSAAALEFSGASVDHSKRLVLYATPEYPCAVELATTPERCSEILARLEQFFPESVHTTLVG
jgi:hypothetical protein